MSGFSPSQSHGDAAANLDELIAASIDPVQFQPAIQRLRSLSAALVASCPPPWPAPGLIVTPEIRYQSELYLPLAEITSAFYRLYRSALSYPPILSSTPFHNALSWADVLTTLPPRLQFSANPARLLEALLADRDLLTGFLFASFLPRRFYGGFRRYPGQQGFVRGWLDNRKVKRFRCLDAACGTGEDTYGLAGLLMESGCVPGDLWIEGWTIEPLEVWAAAHARFPDDLCREKVFRRETAPLFEQGFQDRTVFRRVDLLAATRSGAGFDLILCNGLLGGPIISRREQILEIAANLSDLLRPGGMLLVADHFHGGWKKNITGDIIGDVLETCGLKVMKAGEGIGGLKKW